MKMISDAEVEKRIKAWADVTMLSIELKRAALRKRYPEYSDDEIRHLIRKELSDAQDKPMMFEKISLLRSTLKSNLDIFVDFLFADNDFQKEALSRRQAIKVADFTVNIPTPEDLILLKLISGREQDRLDAKKVFEIQKKHLDMEYIKRWSKKLQVQLPD